MKIVALALMLVLQTTGLWSRLPASPRTRLADTAADEQVAATSGGDGSNAATATSVPVRLGTESLQLEPGTSVLAIDRSTGTPLYAQAADQARPIASVTKMVTALVILSRHDPSETVTVGALPHYEADDDTIGLVAGERYRLGDLVRAALIPSANDAADALAIDDAGSTAAFAVRMNAKLAAWGIAGAHFSNPSGLQDTGNYATAEALAHLAMLALANPFVATTVQQTRVSLTSTAGRTLSANTTDDLLASGQFYGIKTGYTGAAGECFVGLTRAGGHDIITVVLGSSDRFGETQQLASWVGRNYQWF